MNSRKRIISTLIAITVAFSCIMMISVTTSAATTGLKPILNKYDGGRYYSGRYQVTSDFGQLKGSLFGKKYTIECVNYLSQLNNSECGYFGSYSRFGVWICRTNGKVYKYIDGLKHGSSFKLPLGKWKVVIKSSIDPSGWDSFSYYTNIWTFAMYRLRY